jgi:phosphohistidine phosphatase
MELFILRHAIAEDRTLHPVRNDSERPLTAKGEKRMWRLTEGMKVMDLSFDLILSSPFARAKRTAEIVAEAFRLRKALGFSQNLVPDGNPKELIEEIKVNHGKSKRILLVGHEPYLSRLISLLVSGDTSIAITLKKAGLCKLSIDVLQYGQCATLEWLVTPGILRRVQ